MVVPVMDQIDWQSKPLCFAFWHQLGKIPGVRFALGILQLHD